MERTRSLSIKGIKRYKMFGYSGILFVLCLYAYSGLQRGDTFGLIMSLGIGAMVIFYWYPNIGKFLSRLKEVSYDSENLYVVEGDTEVQIPFVEIRDVEIVSLDGLYKFNLFRDSQFGKEIMCKPSNWYPFNFKKVDRELNRVRALINKAHWEYKEQITDNNQLASFT